MDLISRQALAEHKFTVKECEVMGEAGAYRVGWNDAIDAIIDNAPSAEPEIIYCKDCCHLLPRNGYCKTWDWYIANDVFYCGCGDRRTDDQRRSY